MFSFPGADNFISFFPSWQLFFVVCLLLMHSIWFKLWTELKNYCWIISLPIKKDIQVNNVFPTVRVITHAIHLWNENKAFSHISCSEHTTQMMCGRAAWENIWLEVMWGEKSDKEPNTFPHCPTKLSQKVFYHMIQFVQFRLKKSCTTIVVLLLFCYQYLL